MQAITRCQLAAAHQGDVEVPLRVEFHWKMLPCRGHRVHAMNNPSFQCCSSALPCSSCSPQLILKNIPKMMNLKETTLKHKGVHTNPAEPVQKHQFLDAGYPQGLEPPAPSMPLNRLPTTERLLQSISTTQRQEFQKKHKEKKVT